MKKIGLRRGFKTMDERIAQVMPLAAAGKNTSEIAEALGISNSRVLTIAKAGGFQVAHTPPANGLQVGHKREKDRIAEICALARAGHNRRQIAAITGLAVPTVGRFLVLGGEARSRQVATVSNAGRVASETVDVLVGAAHGVDLFRNVGLAIDAPTALGLLKDLRGAMASLRWFERTLREIANVRDHEAQVEDSVGAVCEDEGGVRSAAGDAPATPEHPPG